MFTFKKDNKSDETSEKAGFFKRLSGGLARTRGHIAGGMASLLLGRKTIDEALFDEIETLLLTADVGVEATQAIIDDLTQRSKRKELKDGAHLLQVLQENLEAMLAPCSLPLSIDDSKQPFIILMVGVNGAGKTTTIGKLAKRFKAQGKSVMLAAGDTFRAAAVEQLQVWGERGAIPVVAQQAGADPASVIFDAIESARARSVDVLIADTAGRLHTQHNLLQELMKVKRVITKLDDSAPHEVMLVLDASIGQNALQQAREFNKAVAISGITVTKLDGTAKGGILFAIAKELGMPIRYIGVGEGIDDLQDFNAKDFVSALFEEKV